MMLTDLIQARHQATKRLEIDGSGGVPSLQHFTRPLLDGDLVAAAVGKFPRLVLVLFDHLKSLVIFCANKSISFIYFVERADVKNL